MIQEFRRHTERALLFWMLLLHIEQGFSQTGVLQVDHANGAYSTSANVKGNFQISLIGSLSYRLAWRFNEIDICTAAINSGPTLVPASLVCDTSGHAIGSNDLYYASNSEISGSVNGSVLSLVLLYRTAILEESPLRMDVTNGAAVISNVVSITVQNCTKNSSGLIGTSVTESCGFNCIALAVCDSSERINVTCQDDATWRQLKNCTTAPCPINNASCEDCCSSTGDPLPADLDDGQNITVVCCEGYNGGNETLTCESASTLAAKLTCVPDPTSSSTAVGISTSTPISGTGSTGSGGNVGRMSPGDVAGTVFACVDGLLVVALIVVTAVGSGLNTAVFIVYIIGAALVSVVGILMSFLGSNGGSDLNGVEIAGIVFGCVGGVMAIGGLIFQLSQGKVGKGYRSGSNR